MRQNVLNLAAFGVALGGLGIVTPSAALAGSHRFSANICNPTDGVNAGSFSYDPTNGVWNMAESGSVKAVTCGINLTDAPIVKNVQVIVFDRNSGDISGGNGQLGEAHNIKCYVALIDINGSPFASETARTPWGSSTHSNYWGAWNLAYPAPTLNQSGQYVIPDWNVQAKAIVVKCTLPAYQPSGNGASYVTSIEVNTSN